MLSIDFFGNLCIKSNGFSADAEQTTRQLEKRAIRKKKLILFI